jgi:hypothetical protein
VVGVWLGGERGVKGFGKGRRRLKVLVWNGMNDI